MIFHSFIYFYLETLRALYLGDNDFEYLSPEIRNLKNLQIVSINIPFTHAYNL